MLAVKKLAILPAPIHAWHDMANYARFNRPDIRLVGDVGVSPQKSFQTGD
jgi:hypothetical protein